MGDRNERLLATAEYWVTGLGIGRSANLAALRELASEKRCLCGRLVGAASLASFHPEAAPDASDLATELSRRLVDRSRWASREGAYLYYEHTPSGCFYSAAALDLEIARAIVDEIVPDDYSTSPLQNDWMPRAAEEIGAARPELAGYLLAPADRASDGAEARKREDVETIQMLALLGQPTPLVLSYLMTRAEGHARDQRIAAIRALGRLRAKPATALLAQAAHSRDDEVQWAAFWALRAVDPDRSVVALDALRREDPEFVERWERMLERLRTLH